MDKAADYILNGGTELDRAKAECDVTAHHLGIALDETSRLRAALEGIQRILAPGNRTFDEMIRDVGRADDLARAALSQGR